MQGLMQDFPLVIPRLLTYAEKFHPYTEIVSRRLEGDIHRYTFADMGKRARRLANALRRLGVTPGQVVGTIAWNGYRHMELYYALPGIQSVYHTINPRLSPEQMIYVINHAEDKYVFVELMFVPLLENIVEQISSVKGFVVLCEREDMPDTSLPDVLCYEDLLARESEELEWDEIDEQLACGICYTSGTTGDPKGVVYSHRSLVLQAMNMSIGLELNCRDSILPIVPMFHVNAWTLPFVTALLGTKLVLPGRALDGASIHHLLTEEKVTVSAGVPTVFLMLINHLDEINGDLRYLNKILTGGSAAPRSLLETYRDKYDVEPLHAWGMTETTSMGAAPSITARVAARSEDAIMDTRLTQGRGVFGAEIKIIDDDGKELPMNGISAGRLCIRGWGIAREYLKSENRDDFLEGGWFDTGDVATINEDGYMQITDRAKDMIKSGGEWISSILVENTAMGCAGVGTAAVIGIYHPKWDERPLLLIVKTPDQDVSKEDILTYLKDKLPKLWLPDDIIFVDKLPIGATGKVNKKALREQFKDFRF